MLQALNVTVELGGARILHAASLGVGAGEVVGVLGPNGAGKSTVLSVLSGSMTPNEGLASLDDRPLRGWAPDALARQRAVMLQHAELSFEFRVLEVVLLGRSPFAGMRSRADDLAAAHAALEETEALHLADRIYTTLSGGERQRVQLARVLAQVDFANPAPAGVSRFLLLDEPTSSLDLSHQHAALRTVRRIAGRGIGVLAILHDLNLAAMYADRIVILHRGRTVADGSPDDVLTEETVQQAFDLPVRIDRHPTQDCPFVVAV